MTTCRRRGSRLLVLAAAAVLVLAGCDNGDGGSSTPATLAPSTSGAPTASPSRSTSPVGVAVSAYFLAKEKVQPVLRRATSSAVATDAVRALLQGPTAQERGQGLSTAIPAGTTLHGIVIKDRLATVDLSSQFGSGGGSASMKARVAQVVFTVTRFPTVDRVSFELDGKPVTALGGEGLLLDEPQTRADYEEQSPAVLVELPRWGETVAVPVGVNGTANVFEAVFFLELRDSTGKVIASRRVQATSGTGTRGTFTATLTPASTASSTGPARLQSYVMSAKDGSRQDVTSIPITLRR